MFEPAERHSKLAAKRFTALKDGPTLQLRLVPPKLPWTHLTHLIVQIATKLFPDDILSSQGDHPWILP